MIRRLAAVVPFILAVGCGGNPPAATAPVRQAPLVPPASAFDEPAPKLRLPTDTHPLAEALTLTIDPKQERFSGAVDITLALDRPRSVLWLHGKDLHVTKAALTPAGGPEIAATWRQDDPDGIASVKLAAPVPAGSAKLHIEYDAAWGPKLEGLHKIVQQGVPYAFTQFEAISARTAFPCLDEPGFKIPWDTTLVVPVDAQGIANTKEIDRRPAGAPGMTRLHFAPTRPLPSYLLAFAVGPFDVVVAPDVPPNAVRKRPLPLRAITTKGHGTEIRYALAHTGEILSALETYAGIEYPYDKLDIIAVPDKGGAMENPGAVTFGDDLLLFDEASAPIWQRKSYAEVMAHELAHQWTGDLVTHAWWNDIWLNESFATWLGAKAADAWDPKTNGALSLLEGVQGAIGADALASARAIRQPIETNDDIENAFDSITYEKGGGVLSMFERWLGADAFQRGFHDYLVKYSFKNATADDFLTAMSASSGKDVKTPFSTFLDQPGVPFVEAELRCDGGKSKVHFKQSRYFPAGSKGNPNQTWQIPICTRYQIGKESKEACTLLSAPEADLDLGGACPDWIFPNADAAGYFRFSLAAKDLAALRSKGLAALSRRERVAFGNSLRAAYNRQALPFKDVLLASVPLASDPHSEIAGEPMNFINEAHSWLEGDPLEKNVESYSRRLYGATGKALGWQAQKTDDEDRIQLRSRILGFLVYTAKDPAMRAEAKRRGLAYLGVGKDGEIHKDAVDPNLTGIAIGVVGEEADRALWEAVRAKLVKTEDPELRGRLLGILTGTRTKELVPRVRDLMFDPILRSTEMTSPLWAQLGDDKLRDETWAWFKTNYDKISQAMPPRWRAQLISTGGVFCDEAHLHEVEAFFTPERVAALDGGPRILANTLESMRLCVFKRQKHEPAMRDFFRTSP